MMKDKPDWMAEYPNLTFYPYSFYLKREYGEPVYRVSLDAGFSCPNRGADRKNHGCLFCSEDGSRAPYLGNTKGIRQQVEGGIKFLEKRYGARRYVLYFQAFSNTYAETPELKKIYDFALSLHPFCEMVVSTRPDCITPEKADLLNSYNSDSLKVWVELGLQSAMDATLRRMNRGHTVNQFLEAYHLLRQKGIKLTIHLLFGLPGETVENMQKTVQFVSNLRPDGIKLHNLHIRFGAPLFTDFLKGEILPLSDVLYRELVIYTLEHLPPDTVIMRLTTDTQSRDLAAPRKFMDKSRFNTAVKSLMAERSTWQGKLYIPP
ncbi:MAG: TIGR01212 family radical SAM protein [Spirochaetales bacterium]|nr:TIGR01212 family radical SAM protein [Spirochaetales bacterium]